MLEVTTVEMNPDSREEYLPGYTPQFPHIASHVVAARYESFTTPWHWHESVELFYLRRGAILYRTPHEERVIRAGQGGMVNSNVLHSTRLPAYLNTHYAEHITTPMLAAAACCGRRPGSAHQITEENGRIVLHSGGCEIAARCAALLY